MPSLATDLGSYLAQPTRATRAKVDQLVCHILQDDEEHAKLPDLEVAQVDIGLERDPTANHLKLEFRAVAGPTGKTINSNAIAQFCNALCIGC